MLGDGGAEQSDAEQDALKQTLLDTNPYLLALTICVSIVHSVFEFLAFKNGEWVILQLHIYYSEFLVFASVRYRRLGVARNYYY